MALRPTALAILLILATDVTTAADSHAELRTLQEQVRSAALQPQRAVAVRNLQLDLGMAVLELEEGVLVPASPVAGHTLELVFEGRGRFRLQPPDALEAQQLELFTGHDALDIPVDRAVLVVGEPSVVARLYERPAVANEVQRLESAKELYGRWLTSPERRGLAVESAILAAAVDDAAYGDYFAAWCHSPELGNFYYLHDPTEDEQVRLGQFKPFELHEVTKAQSERFYRAEQRRGRFIGRRVEDLGNWDTWISAPRRGAAGQPAPGSRGIEPQRYVLDVTVKPAEHSISGRANLELVARRAGQRVVTLDLFHDLVVTAIRDGQGRALPWNRSDSRIDVLLDEPTRVGQPLALAVDYNGVLFDDVQPGIFVIRDTWNWYPRTSTLDRARYDVTLRWPRKYTLVAGGEVIERGEQDGLAWERRRVDIPSIAYSFEVGDFDVQTHQAGHVTVTFAVSKTTGVIKTAKEHAVETIQHALAFYEESFGRYPLDTLTVVTVPRGFSQGQLGFVTLAHGAVWSPPRIQRIVGGPQYGCNAELIAHELAHQWWGNKVGWASYRDQWLSEALADYSAIVFYAQQAKEKPVYLAAHSERWRSSLTETTKDGRTIESLGPPVAGERLHSSISPSAYQAIVYDKGSVVFGMLARSLEEDAFLGMLEALADSVNHRNIDTATFIKAIAHMSGLDLSGFADQFIYGTGLPNVYYSYEIVPVEGGWEVRGEAQQLETGIERWRAVRVEAGWELEQDAVPRGPAEGRFTLAVPFQISLEGEESRDVGDPRRGVTRPSTARGLGGTVILRGGRTPFNFRTPRKPRRLWLDQRGEVLASFHSQQDEPKRALHYEAIGLARAGDYEHARAKLEQALASPAVSAQLREDEEIKPKALEERARLEDILVLLELARVHIQLKQPEAARAALSRAEDLVQVADGGFADPARLIAHSRLDLMAGDYRSIFARMSRRLEIDPEAPVRPEAFWSRWRSRQLVLDGEAYALLAVAAHETGHPQIARTAAVAAERRGANMKALQTLLRD